MTEKQSNTKRDDGGPAFPTDATAEHGIWIAKNAPGMSLRDYFAGQALVGFLAHPSGLKGAAERMATDEISVLSVASYEIADALLRERAK